jgi:hypothetical protein
LHNLSLAMQNFVQAQRRYPGYLDALPIGSAAADTSNPAQLQRVTWLVRLLPYIERGDIYELYRQGDYLDPGAKPGAEDPRLIYLDWLNCPSDPAGREWLDRQRAGENPPTAGPPC